MKTRFGIVVVVLLALMFGVTSAHAAAWTLTPSQVSQAGHYIKWKVVCTSNGSALTATDLLAHANMPTSLLRKIQGETLMAMKISPGTDAVIPDTTIDVTLSDEESDALFAVTGASKDAISWHSMADDIGMYIPVTGKLYLTISDIGTSGDQVTLYFLTWREDI